MHFLQQLLLAIFVTTWWDMINTWSINGATTLAKGKLTKTLVSEVQRSVYNLIKASPGKSSSSAVKSCKWLKENYNSSKTGLYWISLESPTKVYCDMETGKGGWTMIGNTAVVDESSAEEGAYKHAQSEDISKLSNVINGRFLLNGYGLWKLRQYIGFTQIRFYCHKKWHGRTLHIYTLNNTVGSDVLDMVMEKTNTGPASCGSYTTFSDDTSEMGRSCEKWEQYKWYANKRSDFSRMYIDPMMLRGKKYTRHFSLIGWDVDRVRMECDDYARDKTHPNYSNIGQWSFYVR